MPVRGWYRVNVLDTIVYQHDSCTCAWFSKRPFHQSLLAGCSEYGCSLGNALASTARLSRPSGRRQPMTPCRIDPPLPATKPLRSLCATPKRIFTKNRSSSDLEIQKLLVLSHR